VKRLVPILVGAALVSSCAYYNAMYNARRLSDAAEKAESEGRRFDASTLWGQVTVKAETVIARHPDSKYAPEAYALMGRAHARLGNCTRARPALESALAAPLDSALALETELWLAGCHADLGQQQEAIGRYERLIAVGGPALQRSARTGLVRSLRIAGRTEEAARIVDAHPDLPPVERLSALAAAGRGPAVLALADSLIAVGDSTVPWDSVIGWLAARDRLAASALVDRADSSTGATPGVLANRLLADGARFSDDPARARARLEQVRDQTAAPDAAATARLELIRLDMRSATSREQLEPILEALAKEVAESPLGPQAQLMQRSVEQVAFAVDSSAPGSPAGDMRVFLAAEAARDRLVAPRLAASLFRSIAAGWPASPYAPKALLAAAVLEGDTLLAAEAESRYPASPYVLAVGDTAVANLRALEDSLGAFADSVRTRPPAPVTAPRPAGARPGPVRTGTPTGPVR
jgi:tetratricopeptide (TPR) repeat protein